MYAIRSYYDFSHSKHFSYDGIGRNFRQGLNFVEKGFGLRGALGVSDRAHTAAAALKPGDIDWNKLFVEEGVRWFHTGGIYAALSDTAAELRITSYNVCYTKLLRFGRFW